MRCSVASGIAGTLTPGSGLPSSSRTRRRSSLSDTARATMTPPGSCWTIEVLRGRTWGVKDAGRVVLVHCGVDIRRVLWILLVVLTVLGGVAAVGIAANERKKLPAGGGSAPKQLTA